MKCDEMGCTHWSDGAVDVHKGRRGWAAPPAAGKKNGAEKDGVRRDEVTTTDGTEKN